MAEQTEIPGNDGVVMKLGDTVERYCPLWGAWKRDRKLAEIDGDRVLLRYHPGGREDGWYCAANEVRKQQ